MLSFLVAIIILVFVHELGHYALARWAGVHVQVFSVGFGTELLGYTDKNGTRWRISAIPLGGYVRMLGGDGDHADDIAKLTDKQKQQCYVHKTVGQRAMILGAGPFANLVFAIVVLAGLYGIQGKPTAGDFPAQGISKVVAGSPAHFAGFKAGDVVTAVDGVAVQSYRDLPPIITASNGQALVFDIMRNGQTLNLTATPRWNPATGRQDGRYFLGVGMPQPVYKAMSPIQSVTTAWQDIWHMTGLMLAGLGDMFVNDIPVHEQLAGPVRIAEISSHAVDLGVFQFVMFLSVLSLNLAIMNLLPIPMLDGGHLLFCAIEAIRGKPVSKQTQELALRIGLSVLLTLMVLALWGDVLSLLEK